MLKGPGTLVDGVFTPANEKARDSSRIEGSIPGIVLGRTPNRADGKRYLLTRYEWAFDLHGDMRVCLPAGMMP